MAPRGRIDESIVKACKRAREHATEISVPEPVADVSEASHS
ncbi:MAG: hypothetical protein JWN03_6132 [Nocardia sp.]|nr:hypothetical protein [Nocardia sp.]